MHPADPLRAREGRLVTRMGGAFPGSHAVFRGHDLHKDLAGMEWLELYLFGITGRRFQPNELKLLNAIWVMTSYPDARLWNNRVAALAGSARSTGNLAISAALAVSEASIYGRGIDLRIGNFLIDTCKRVANGAAVMECVLEEIGRYRNIAGYGRPIASGDERLQPILDLAHSLGLDRGPHLALAFEVEKTLMAGRWRWKMNYAAVAVALTADLGLSLRTLYLFGFPAFLAGVVPCLIEAQNTAPGLSFPLSCSLVRYSGQHKRKLPARPNQ